MTICYFGIYNPDYSRNRILIKGLRRNGVEVLECRSSKKGLLKYFDLIRRHWKIRKKYDFLIAGFPGNHSVILAKLLTRRPIVFDAYLSLYNALIFDRQESSPASLRARYYWMLDWLPARLADRVLLDTEAHIDFFLKTFQLPREKFIRVLIGADDDLFYPRPSRSENCFIVGFHGMFVPTQGAEEIVRAAKILENNQEIKFYFIGSGRDYRRAVELANNFKLDKVKFFGRVDWREVPDWVAKMDIVLGNFGTTDKTSRVIANKSYESLAMKKPHLSARVPAMEEIFQDQENILFCRQGDPEDLAEKIVQLKEDSALREKIAREGYRLFQAVGRPEIIVRRLLNNLVELAAPAGRPTIPALEITTRIGCRNNCAYCPQDKIVQAYRRRSAPWEMSLEIFKKCLKKLPKKTVIEFSGFAEPWLNPACTEMVLAAHRAGHPIRVFTTLTGMTLADFERLKEVSFERFWIHLPSDGDYEKIKINRDYFEVFKAALDFFSNQNQTDFGCHVRGGRIHPELRELAADRVRTRGIGSRAGNLSENFVISIPRRPGKIGCKRNLLQNVLLPNGEVILCCMDYGLEHSLGNLLVQDYYSLFWGEEFLKIRRGLDDARIEILCRYCDMFGCQRNLTGRLIQAAKKRLKNKFKK